MLEQAATLTVIMALCSAKGVEPKPTRSSNLLPLVVELESLLPRWRDAIDRHDSLAENVIVIIFHRTIISLNGADQKRALELLQKRDHIRNYAFISSHYARLYSGRR